MTIVNLKTDIPAAATVEYATDAYYTVNSGYDKTASDGLTDTFHHIALTALEPGTLYHYRVSSGGRTTGDLHFRTFPETGAFTFVVYSDTQDQLPTFSQLERHKLVADRIADEPGIAFVLNSGDLVNNATNLSDWDRYFAAGSMMMANTTVFPALGNHDRYEPYYSEIYGVPEYYSFDCGDAHVTVLNSNSWAWPDLPSQSAWLAADLGTEKPFRFVSFHHPIYSSESKHFGGWENLRLEWEDDFNENGVLAVFNGHVHAYERLVVNDTNYFVAGIGGAPSYNLADPRYEASVNSLEYMIGYTRVRVDPAARTATAEVIRVADISSDLKTVTTVYPPDTIFETVVMALPGPPVEPHAIILSPPSPHVAEGTTCDFQLSISSLPEGLSGYDLAVTLSNPSIAEITGVQYPGWAGMNNTTPLPQTDSLRLSGVDLGRNIQAGAEDVLLATITVRADSTGTSAFVISNVNMDADGGGIITPEISSGEIVVYAPLVANFTANVTSGKASLAKPLFVQFTDLSAGDPPVSSWSWDFDNDGVVDSTLQDPVASFNRSGNYTVNLTVQNTYSSDTEVKVDYIRVTSLVKPFPGQTSEPTDPDGDGLYEDINGNGRLDYDDVVIYYDNMQWIRDQPDVGIEPYDYNGNGRIDYDDVVVLYQELLASH
jgi:PKD repeat protein